MTPRQRAMTAMRHGVPDRVPVSPGIGPWYATRILGLSMWDVTLGEPNVLVDVMLEMNRRYGYDDWCWWADPGLEGGRRDGPPVVWREEVLQRDEKLVLKRFSVETDYGPLERVILYPKLDPEWEIEKPIKDIDADWPKLRALLGEEWSWKAELPTWCARIGEQGIMPLFVDLPIDWWFKRRHGGVEQLIFDLLDRRELMHHIFAFYQDYAMVYLDAALQAGPDEIAIDGSCSSISMISPALYREYNLPFLQEVAQRCKAAGVISHQHNCGKSLAIVKMVHAETDLDVQEPLEPPPGGDVDLSEAKRRFGDKLCLRGNVNTFETLLRGTPAEVEAAARHCIEAAAAGGGFWLASGDQVGRDTPEENIWAMIEAARKYGQYTAEGRLR